MIQSVLDSVSFHLHRGEFTVLVGTNGAGKTTVLKLILGLLEPSAGEIVFSGTNRQPDALKPGMFPSSRTTIPPFR